MVTATRSNYLNSQRKSLAAQAQRDLCGGQTERIEGQREAKMQHSLPAVPWRDIHRGGVQNHAVVAESRLDVVAQCARYVRPPLNQARQVQHWAVHSVECRHREDVLGLPARRSNNLDSVSRSSVSARLPLDATGDTPA
jgi:hypothetical protein